MVQVATQAEDHGMRSLGSVTSLWLLYSYSMLEVLTKTRAPFLQEAYQMFRT